MLCSQAWPHVAIDWDLSDLDLGGSPMSASRLGGLDWDAIFPLKIREVRCI